MSSSLTIEVVEEGTSDLDFLTMTPNFSDLTSDILPSFSNSIDFSPNPSLLPPITNTFRHEINDNPPNAAYIPNLSSELLTKQQPKRRVTNNQSFDRTTFELNPPKNLSLLSKKSDGVSNSVPAQFSPPTEGVNSVKIPTSVATTHTSQPQRSKLRRLRKPMNNSKKSSSPPTSLPAQNLSVNTNTGFDYSQRLKTPSVNNDASPLFPEYSNTSQVDQVTDEDDVFLKEEEITEYCSDRVDYSASAFDSYQLEDMDSQEMFDSFTPIILHSDDPFMDDEEVSDAFLYPEPQLDAMNGIVIPPPLLMTQPNNPSSMPHYIPPIQDDKSIADKSKKSLRRASKNKSQKPILPSNLRNEVVSSLIRVESKETVQSTASDSSESTSQTSIPSRSKSQAIYNSNGAIQNHSKPKQPDNPNKQITFCDSGYEMPATKKSIPTPQIQFVSNTPKAPQGISKPCKMSTSSGWKFHNFDREKQPIRDSSGLTYHFYQPKSKIAATTQ